MASLSIYIANLNSMLKNIKSEIMADFAWMDQHGIIITTNKIASSLDLQTIKNYVKNLEYIDSEDVESSCLPQLKFYLKIIGISYLIENTNMLINSSFVESILKISHIFNNISIALKSKSSKCYPNQIWWLCG